MKDASRPQKVLILVQHLGVGGLENVVLNLCLELKKGGLFHPLVWIYDSFRDQPTMVEVFKKNQIEVFEHFKPQGFSLSALFSLRRFLSENNIKLVSSHDLGPLIYATLARLLLLGKMRLIHTQHSFVHVRRQPRLALYEKIFSRLTHTIVAVSESISSEYLALGVSPRKIKIIPNGVSAPSQPKFNREEKQAQRELVIQSLQEETVRGRLQTLVTSLWIVCVARLYPRKGHAQMLALWSSLPAELRVQCALIWVGPEAQTDFADSLKSQIQASPNPERIVWVGPSFQPSEWYRSSDVFLSLSEEEGMPLAPIEASTYGLPLVLSKIPGHEFLRPYSFQYELKSPEQGVEILSTLLSDLKIAPEAYLETLWNQNTPLRKAYSSEQMTSQYVKLFLGPK